MFEWFFDPFSRKRVREDYQQRLDALEQRQRELNARIALQREQLQQNVGRALAQNNARLTHELDVATARRDATTRQGYARENATRANATFNINQDGASFGVGIDGPRHSAHYEYFPRDGQAVANINANQIRLPVEPPRSMFEFNYWLGSLRGPAATDVRQTPIETSFEDDMRHNYMAYASTAANLARPIASVAGTVGGWVGRQALGVAQGMREDLSESFTQARQQYHQTRQSQAPARNSWAGWLDGARQAMREGDGGDHGDHTDNHHEPEVMPAREVQGIARQARGLVLTGMGATFGVSAQNAPEAQDCQPMIYNNFTRVQNDILRKIGLGKKKGFWPIEAIKAMARGFIKALTGPLHILFHPIHATKGLFYMVLDSIVLLTVHTNSNLKQLCSQRMAKRSEIVRDNVKAFFSNKDSIDKIETLTELFFIVKTLMHELQALSAANADALILGQSASLAKVSMDARHRLQELQLLIESPIQFEPLDDWRPDEPMPQAMLHGMRGFLDKSQNVWVKSGDAWDIHMSDECKGAYDADVLTMDFSGNICNKRKFE